MERYRAKIGRVLDDGPPGEGRRATVMADCEFHTHAERIARALNQHEGAVSNFAAILRLTYHEDMPDHLADAIRPLCAHPANPPRGQ